jgi:molecular chaperone GrpE
MVAVAAKGSTGPSTGPASGEQSAGAANPYAGAAADGDNSGGSFDQKA